jgi:outer membrane protein TolC
MKKIVFYSLLVLATTATAQNNVRNVMNAIQQNNTTLQALKQFTAAQKIEYKTGITLDGPQLDAAYLYGNPSNIGNRTDFSFTQKFDPAILAGAKQKLANKQGQLADMNYQAQQNQLLKEAELLCNEVVYLNILILKSREQLQLAQTLADIFDERLKAGDIGITDYNKAALNLAAVQGDLAVLKAEQNNKLRQLQLLNGGIEVALTDTAYTTPPLPDNFDDWLQNAAEQNPELNYAKLAIEVGKQYVKLEQINNLPTLEAGFMSETVTGQQFKGVTVGVSIPLWANKNKVKSAKAASYAAQLHHNDRQLQLNSQLRSLYEQAQLQAIITQNYQNALDNLNNTQLLQQALNQGQISITEYILETTLYFNMVQKLIDSRKKYADIVVTMNYEAGGNLM